MVRIALTITIPLCTKEATQMENSGFMPWWTSVLTISTTIS